MVLLSCAKSTHYTMLLLCRYDNRSQRNLHVDKRAIAHATSCLPYRNDRKLFVACLVKHLSHRVGEALGIGHPDRSGNRPGLRRSRTPSCGEIYTGVFFVIQLIHLFSNASPLWRTVGGLAAASGAPRRQN